MTQATLSSFQQYPDPLKPRTFNPQDYSADPQASDGNSPYDQWLYSQNKRLANFNLPAYQSRYPTPQQPQVQAPPGTETYTNQRPPVTWKQPGGYPGPAPGGFAGVQTVVGPYSDAPKTAEQLAYGNQRKFIQDTMANNQADPSKGISQLAAAGIDYRTANDALNYTGYDVGGQQVDSTAYLRAHGGGLEGITTYSPEQVTAFINQQNQGTNILGGANNYDTQDPAYRARVQETMDRAERVASMRGQEAPSWLDAAPTAQQPTAQQAEPAYQQVAGSFISPSTGNVVTYDSAGAHTDTGQKPMATGGLVRPFSRGGLADLAHNYGIQRSI